MIITRKHFFSFVFLLIFSLLQLASFFLFSQPAKADQALLNSQIGISNIANTYGKGGGQAPSDIRVVVVNIIEVLLGFLGIIFFVLILTAGFRYMTAAGNDDQTKKAISQITSATLGLLIVIASWLLTSAIIRYFARAVNGSAQIFE